MAELDRAADDAPVGEVQRKLAVRVDVVRDVGADAPIRAVAMVLMAPG